MQREFLDAVFDERCDPAMLDELFNWRRLEHAWILAAEHLELVEQFGDPRATVLDVGNPQPREPLEQLVPNEHGREVLHQTVFHQHLDKRLKQVQRRRVA